MPLATPPGKAGHGRGSSSELVTATAARAHLLDAVAPITETETLALQDALGRILAERITASVAVPPADNSAMDGYALRAADLEAAGGTLSVVQRIPAGMAPEPLPAGSAARIFTGALIPDGADTVVMQERCHSENKRVTVDGPVRAGDNIRRAGEDIQSGAPLLEPGQRLRPQDLGLVASTGLATLPVRRRVRVAMAITGDELVAPGEPLPPGHIYNSNQSLLTGMLLELGCEVLPARPVADGADATRTALAALAEEADLVISSGGVSVGEEDHVRGAVEALGELGLWRVAIKPGKPLAFGRIGDTPFLGLPGNPVSAFVTFLLFGAPLLRRLQGRDVCFPAPERRPAGFARPRPGTREEYLRVRPEDGRLIAYPHQGSGVLSSAVWAEGLARAPVDTVIGEGDAVDYFSFTTLLS